MVQSNPFFKYCKRIEGHFGRLLNINGLQVDYTLPNSKFFRRLFMSYEFTWIPKKQRLT